jgi:hypothetical protein
MFSLLIVIHFYVFENPGFCRAPIHISFAVNVFDFQRVKETLHCCIVITVGSAPHAAVQTIGLDQSLISL